jgi:hypothetical protein
LRYIEQVGIKKKTINAHGALEGKSYGRQRRALNYNTERDLKLESYENGR